MVESTEGGAPALEVEQSHGRGKDQGHVVVAVETVSAALAAGPDRSAGSEALEGISPGHQQRGLLSGWSHAGSQPSAPLQASFVQPPPEQSSRGPSSSNSFLPLVPGQQAPSKIVLLEICCGSARLCSAFVNAGMTALGVDHSGNRFAPVSPWIMIDVATKTGLEQVLAIIRANKSSLALVWIGIACGTASRAREIPRGDCGAIRTSASSPVRRYGSRICAPA